MSTVMDRVQEEQKRNRADDALAEVLSLFDSPDTLADSIARATIASLLHPDAPCRKWSLANRLLMLRAATFDARGFKQWNEAGRKVSKGSRAFYILGPRTIRKENKETGEKETVVVGFVGIPVFGWEQTELMEGKEDTLGYDAELTPEDLPPLMEVADRLGVPVTYVPTEVTTGQGALGWFARRKDGSQEIILGVHDCDVFWHELAHAAHHAAGLLEAASKDRREIVAETVACVLGLMYGHPVTKKSHGYLAHFAGGETPQKAATGALRDIGAVLDVIFPPPSE